MEILLQIIKHFSTTALDNYGGVRSSVSPRCKENLPQLTGDIKRIKTGYSTFVWWANISVISVNCLQSNRIFRGTSGQ